MQFTEHFLLFSCSLTSHTQSKNPHTICEIATFERAVFSPETQVCHFAFLESQPSKKSLLTGSPPNTQVKPGLQARRE
jgi:hypothetical protein